MKFSHKFQKLFHPDVVVSVWERVRRWTHPVNSRQILASLYSLEFERIRERYPYRPNPRRVKKFIKRAQDLWLDRSPPLRILDLGCGAGYFLYVCRLLGHEGIGLDTDDEPLYRETIALLNVPRVVSRIDAQVPLPDLGQWFDLVTATRVCFHLKGWPEIVPGNEWSPADWMFFINDIRTRLLKPEGRLYLEFNPRPDASPFFTPQLRECFLAQGARIFRSKALFAADPARRPQLKQTKSHNSQ